MKLTARDLIAAAIAEDDVLHIVDISDISGGASGTSFKTTRSQISTQTFANDAARTAAKPGFIGQLGVQLDTGITYRGSAFSAGSWTAITIVEEFIPVTQSIAAARSSRGPFPSQAIDSAAQATTKQSFQIPATAKVIDSIKVVFIPAFSSGGGDVLQLSSANYGSSTQAYNTHTYAAAGAISASWTADQITESSDLKTLLATVADIAAGDYCGITIEAGAGGGEIFHIIGIKIKYYN